MTSTPRSTIPIASTEPGRRSATPVQRAQRLSATMSGSFLPRVTSTLSPRATSTAGSSVSAARATATTDRIMPSAIDRNTMTGTRNTAASDSTTVNANVSERDGGLGFEPLYGETTTIISSTISGNTATRVGGVLSKTALYLYNSTIAFNLSTEWTDGTRQFAGGVYIGAPSVAYSTIIANNLSPGSPFPTADVTGADNTGFNGGNNDVMFWEGRARTTRRTTILDCIRSPTTAVRP